jgi:hypothetical protein
MKLMLVPRQGSGGLRGCFMCMIHLGFIEMKCKGAKPEAKATAPGITESKILHVKVSDFLPLAFFVRAHRRYCGRRILLLDFFDRLFFPERQTCRELNRSHLLHGLYR